MILFLKPIAKGPLIYSRRYSMKKRRLPCVVRLLIRLAFLSSGILILKKLARGRQRKSGIKRSHRAMEPLSGFGMRSINIS